MRDGDLDDILKNVPGSSPDVDPQLLARIAQAMGPSLQPVRPLPPSPALVTALAAACVGVAALGGTILGLHGIQNLGATGIAVIFPVLAILIWLAADVSVGEMIPGSRHRAAPRTMLAAACLALTAIFALLFRDYGMEDFVHQGMKCLTAGLLHAIPVGAIGWWVLRRGFAVDSVAAGFAQGTLAGLAGVVMLELHCVNFEAPHVMVWHTSVLLLSGVAGGGVAWAGRALRAKR